MAAPYKVKTPAAPTPRYRMAGTAPAPAAAPDDQWEDLGLQPIHPALAVQATPGVTATPGAGTAGDDEWEDLGTQTPEEASQTAAKSKPPVKEPGMLGKAWRWANTPLISEQGRAEREGEALAVAPPSAWDVEHPTLSGIKKGVAGAYADTLGLARSFTSPLSIATMGIGAAGRIPGAVGKIAKAAQLGISGGFAAKGVVDTADAVSKPGAMSPEDIQKMFYGAATGVGGVAGAGDAVSGLSPELGARMMNRIVRPGVKYFKFKQNPGQAVLDEGLTANSTEELADKIQTRRGEIGQDIRRVRTGPAGQAVSVDATKAILDPLNDAMQQAQKEGRADLHQKLQDVQNQLTQEWAPDANGKLSPTGPRKLSGLNAQELYDLKHQVDNVTKWSGAGFDSELNQVKVAVRSNLRDLENQNLPAVAPYRLRYSAMKNAEIPAEARTASEQRNAALSLPDYVIAGEGIVPGLAELFQGGSLEGALGKAGAGIGAVALKRALQSPALQTRAAQWLAGNTPEPTGPITQAIHDVAAPFRPASAVIAAAPKYRLKKAR